MWKEHRRKIIKREEGNLTDVLRQDNYKNIIIFRVTTVKYQPLTITKSLIHHPKNTNNVSYIINNVQKYACMMIDR
jgi:hypothetical protein